MKRKLVVFIAFVSLFANIYAQDSLKYKTIGIGGGLIIYPEGKIYGFTHNYYLEYPFSQHFGAKLSLDFGEGQNNEKYNFDFSKSTMFGVGLIYAPLKKSKNFNINTSFSVFKNTRILGTKDDLVNSNYAFSKFTSYEKFTFYSLNLGLQYPILEKKQFLFAARIDTWASWLKIDAMSVKLLVGFNF